MTIPFCQSSKTPHRARRDMFEAKMNTRNWTQLLLATLERCRGHLPTGPFTDEEIGKLNDIERSKAELKQDIDELFKLAAERGEL
jgi:hypothetical protein